MEIVDRYTSLLFTFTMWWWWQQITCCTSSWSFCLSTLDKALSDCCTNWVLVSRQRERKKSKKKKNKRRENSSSTQILMRFFQDKKKFFHDGAGRIFLWVRNVDKLNLHCGSSSPFVEGKVKDVLKRMSWDGDERKRRAKDECRLVGGKESFQLLLCDVDSLSSLSLSYTLKFS